MTGRPGQATRPEAGPPDLRPVGILGGMGPEATILLQQKVLRRVEARDDADHVPLMIDMNPQVPSRIAHLIDGTGPSPAPVLAGMAARLERMGATALAMPCNTAHSFAETIRQAVAVPFLDMIDLAADACAAAAGADGRVGMLASPALQITGIYDRALAARGLAAVWPGDTGPLLTSIRAIKTGGPTEAGAQGLRAASEELLGQGVPLQLLACTEFSLVRNRLPPETAVVDALDALAADIVRHSVQTGPSERSA